jgi:hypothetical protein
MGSEQIHAGIRIIALDFDVYLRIGPGVSVENNAVAVVFRTEIEVDDIAMSYEFGGEVLALQVQHIKHRFNLVDSGLRLLQTVGHFLQLVFSEEVIVHYQQHFPGFAIGKIVHFEGAYTFVAA